MSIVRTEERERGKSSAREERTRERIGKTDRQRERERANYRR